MKRLHVSRTIDVPAAAVWDLLTDTDQWPTWGPSIRAATCETPVFGLGSTGTVTAVGGLRLAYTVTAFEPGQSWSWRIHRRTQRPREKRDGGGVERLRGSWWSGGVPATDHSVEDVGPGRCRVTFGVPAVLWPYLAVCAVALRRIDRLAATAQE